ncbi:MAG TPA: beta-galactosidase trimerization domain-containing protein, partial [Chloroflexota bacterium]|nr:beta-galactosidase trimerization domain-containing protein [Chloroflexota bacterium]
VAMDPGSHAIEWVDAASRAAVPGRLADDGAHGAALLAVTLMQAGIPTTLTPMATLPHRAPDGGLVALSHVVGWDNEQANDLLAFADSGGTLLLDATSGRKDLDSTLQRPWPGGLAERIGLRATGLQTRPEGYDLSMYGLPTGRWLLARLMAHFEEGAGWEAWVEPRFAADGQPCVWERSYGLGRIVVVRGMLGPSLVHAPECLPAVTRVLERACPSGSTKPVGSHPATTVVPVRVERGELTAVFAPDPVNRGGKPVRLHMPHGEYVDLWTGDPIEVTADGEVSLSATDGIALLWRPPFSGA